MGTAFPHTHKFQSFVCVCVFSFGGRNYVILASTLTGNNLTHVQASSTAHLVLIYDGESDRPVDGSGEVWQTIQVGNKWQPPGTEQNKKNLSGSFKHIFNSVRNKV